MAKFSFSEFKSCEKEPPTTNGYYLVICLYRGEFTGYAQAIEYTTEWGWNSSKFNHDNVIPFTDDADTTYFWGEVKVFG